MDDDQQSTNSHQQSWWHLRPFGPPIVLAVIASRVSPIFIISLIGCGSNDVPSSHVIAITNEPPPIHGAVGLRLACHPVLDSNIAEVASKAKDDVVVDGKLVARWAVLTADAPKDDVVVRSVARKKEILVLLRRFDIRTVDLEHARASGAFLVLTLSSSRQSGKMLSLLTRHEALAHADEKHSRRLALIIDNAVISLKRVVSQLASADPVELDLENENVAFLAALAINQAIADRDNGARTKRKEDASQEKQTK
jgi:hypothetical protein